jgi:hypothetical protein
VTQTAMSLTSDDLSMIRQLGPGTIAAFEQAGLSTLKALAEKSPAELAATSGYPVDRILREDWIGQARRLSGEAPKRADIVVAPPLDPSHRVATFRLELTVEPDGRVHHTDVMYLQNEMVREIWSDWDVARLADFVRRAANFETPDDRVASLIVAPERVPLTERDHAWVEPFDFDLKLHEGEKTSTSQILGSESSAEVELGFSLHGVVPEPLHAVRYNITVFALEIDGDHRAIVAEADSEGEFGDGEFLVRLPIWNPPAGLYRLRADVIVAPRDADEPQYAARLRSNPVLVREPL